MKKVLVYIGLSFLGVCLAVLVYLYGQLKDPHPGYVLDLSIPMPQNPSFKAGADARSITPTDWEPWQDLNQNAMFDDEEPYEDLNKNGQFDTYWMAGFQSKRAMNGIHDSLWVRTVVWDDGTSRVALVSVDVIGLGHKSILDIRLAIPDSLQITHTVIANTHNHEAPDVIGLWGPSQFTSGVNEKWMQHIQDQVIASIQNAVSNLESAHLIVGEDLSGADHMVGDTRPPFVKDSGLRVMQFVANLDAKTIATVIAWGNHPETIWNKNLLLTSDFPHYLREGMEKGIPELQQPGLGGVSLFVVGAIGGLMTTHQDSSFVSKIDGKTYQEPTFDKVKAQGYELAHLCFEALKKGETIQNPGLSIRAKTVLFDMDNRLFRLALATGLLDGGFVTWGKVRSEVSAWSLGPVTLLFLPGEVYPELVNGGIAHPKGADFEVEGTQKPYRNQIKSKYQWVIGLANDEIGYVLPRSQWDVEPPFTYQYQEAPYGEIMSLGPNTANTLSQAVQEVLPR